MKSLYKEGDVVTVLDKFLKGTTETDYSYGLIKIMLENFGGKQVTIETVHLDYSESYKKLNREPIRYYIKEDGNDFMWSAEMFQETYQSSIIKPTIF